LARVSKTAQKNALSLTSAGIANAVGLAIAQAHMGAVFNKDGFELISNHTYGENLFTVDKLC
jgi:hypothetical protein